MPNKFFVLFLAALLFKYTNNTTACSWVGYKYVFSKLIDLEQTKSIVLFDLGSNRQREKKDEKGEKLQIYK